jgi:hypothetical protein
VSTEPRYPGHEPWRYSALSTADPSRFDLAQMDESGHVKQPPARTIASSPLAPPPPDPTPKKPKTFQVEHATQTARSGFQGACGKNAKAKKAAPKEKTPEKTQDGRLRPITHGTRSGYNRGCRLECCKSVEMAWRKKRYRDLHPVKERAPKARILPADCAHPKFWRSRTNQIQCAACGSQRKCDEAIILDVIAGKMPPPKAPGRGKKRIPTVHGTHAAYVHGCRCGECVGFRRKYRRDAYADRKAA